MNATATRSTLQAAAHTAMATATAALAAAGDRPVLVRINGGEEPLTLIGVCQCATRHPRDGGGWDYCSDLGRLEVQAADGDRFHVRHDVVTYAEEDAPIRLEVHICDQRRSYRAEFATADQAVAFIARKSSTHAFYELDDSPIYPYHPRVLEALYPNDECMHGMSADLCSGPMHY